MQHRLTDLDLAVLAAAKIGALRQDTTTRVWTINGQTAMPSLFRLEQAGEIYISLGQRILFPGTDQYREAEAREELIVTIKRGLRDGSIRFEQPKKGTKP